MQTVLNALEEYLGNADFYEVLNGTNPTWNYASMFEYFFAGVLLCITVSFVFKIVLTVVKGLFS